jgi:predicted esterase YcpF (UPF0227 family)
MILYIHGFRSTENSAKAVQFKAYYGEQIHIASFSHVPDQAIQELEQIIQKYEITGLIASSLGGFYATYLSEKYDIKTVLINPSTRPYETLERYLGENETHDGMLFDWKSAYLVQLKEYAIEKPIAENYAVFLKKGDEVLDYQVATNYYKGAQIVVDEGGTHRFEGFEKHFKKVDHFLDLSLIKK